MTTTTPSTAPKGWFVNTYAGQPQSFHTTAEEAADLLGYGMKTIYVQEAPLPIQTSLPSKPEDDEPRDERSRYTLPDHGPLAGKVSGDGWANEYD